MIKNFIIIMICLTLFLLTGYSAVCYASTSMDNICIFLNGQELSLDVKPVVINGRTLVPARAVLEQMQARIEWDAVNKIVTCNKDTTQIKLIIGSNAAYVNGKKTMLDVPAQIIDKRTLIPVRFIAESLNAKVIWLESTRTICILTGENKNTKTITAGFSKPVFLNSVINNGSTSDDYFIHIQDGLTRIDKDGRAIPSIAKTGQFQTMG